MAEPITPEFHSMMNNLARDLDMVFNGPIVIGAKRQTGFVLLVFPFGDQDGRRINYISNADDRGAIIGTFKEMIARWEGQPFQEGHA